MSADYETIILGAGATGIALAIGLIAAGRDDVCILEQGGIPDDLAALAARHELGSYIKVNARAAAAEWSVKWQRWEVAIADAQRITARCLVAAWGRPARLPDIAGRDGARLSAALAGGEALALPGFPNLLLYPDAAAVLAAQALLDEGGAIEAATPLPAFDPAGFARISLPEVKSIYC